MLKPQSLSWFPSFIFLIYLFPISSCTAIHAPPEIKEYSKIAPGNLLSPDEAMIEFEWLERYPQKPRIAFYKVKEVRGTITKDEQQELACLIHYPSWPRLAMLELEKCRGRLTREEEVEQSWLLTYKENNQVSYETACRIAWLQVQEYRELTTAEDKLQLFWLMKHPATPRNAELKVRENRTNNRIALLERQARARTLTENEQKEFSWLKLPIDLRRTTPLNASQATGLRVKQDYLTPEQEIELYWLSQYPECPELAAEKAYGPSRSGCKR